MGHRGFIFRNLRVYTGRFARALLTLYPEVAASPPVWPEEDFWLIAQQRGVQPLGPKILAMNLSNGTYTLLHRNFRNWVQG